MTLCRRRCSKPPPRKSSTRRKDGCPGRPCRRPSTAEKERRLPGEALQTAKQSGEGKTAARGGPADGRAKRRRKDGYPGRPYRRPSKAEKERCTHLNAEFQRIAGRDKKAFLSDQCKEIEENNRMGKTRDLFKKIRH